MDFQKVVSDVFYLWATSKRPEAACACVFENVATTRFTIANPATKVQSELILSVYDLVAQSWENRSALGLSPDSSSSQAESDLIKEAFVRTIVPVLEGYVTNMVDQIFTEESPLPIQELDCSQVTDIILQKS